MKEKKNKKKKEKVVYYDDGRTIADMSGVGGRKLETDDKNFVRPPSTLKDMFKTYIAAVKSMLIPMFITLGALTVVFFLAFWLLGGFNQ